jgi:hypothetical protein
VCISKNGKTSFGGSSHGVLTSPLGFVQLWIQPAGKRIQQQLVNDSGKIIQPYQSSEFVPVSRDRILKMVPVDHFNSGWWKNPYAMPHDLERTQNFANFLRDYNLIGMTKTKLEDLLGPSEGFPHDATSMYFISCGDCGNSAVWVEVEFANECVVRWCLNGAASLKRNWVSSNVLFEPEAKERVFTPKAPEIDSLLK